MPTSLGIALFCALAPLLTGTFAFLGWYVTGGSAFSMVGFVTLMIGVPIVVAGGIALLVFHQRTRTSGAMPPRARRNWTIAVTALLLVNFPAAIVIYKGVVLLASRCNVEIRNESGRALTAVRLHAAERGIDLGPLPAGGTLSATVRPPWTGVETFDVVVDDALGTFSASAFRVGADPMMGYRPEGRRVSLTVREDRTIRGDGLFLRD